MKADDAVRLATALIDNTQTTELNLSNNNLTYPLIDTGEKVHGTQSNGEESTHTIRRANDSGIKALAERIKQTNITSLNMSLNEIGRVTFSEGIRQKSLTGDIGSLVSLIEGTSQLQSLNLIDTNLDIEQAQTLVDAFKANDTLKSLCGNTGYETTLDMSDNMRLTSVDVIMLAPEIKANASLRSLNISKNRMTAAGAQTLARALEDNRTITYLNISNIFLGIGKARQNEDHGVDAICEAIPTMTALMSADLTNNALNERQAKKLVKVLTTSPKLQSLCGNTGTMPNTIMDMSNKSLDNADAFMLAPEIKANTSLTSLNLSNCRINTHPIENLFGVIALADSIKDRIQTLVTFDISNNNLCAAGGRAIVHGLENNHELTELNLANNSLGMTIEKDIDLSGVDAISRAICSMPNLKTLDISNNNIGERVLPEGWKYRSVQTDAEIEKFAEYSYNVYDNGRGHIQLENPGTPDGVKALANAIGDHRRLQTLRMGANGLKGNQAGKILSDALSWNKCLTSLDLSGPHQEYISSTYDPQAPQKCDNEFVKGFLMGKLFSAENKNDSLKSLDIRNNSEIDRSYAKTLQRSCEANGCTCCL